MKNEHEEEMCEDGECPVCGRGEAWLVNMERIPKLSEKEQPYVSLLIVESGKLKGNREMSKERMRELDIDCEEHEYVSELIDIDIAEFIEVAERYGYPRQTIKGMLELSDTLRAERNKKDD